MKNLTSLVAGLCILAIAITPTVFANKFEVHFDVSKHPNCHDQKFWDAYWKVFRVEARTSAGSHELGNWCDFDNYGSEFEFFKINLNEVSEIRCQPDINYLIVVWPPQINGELGIIPNPLQRFKLHTIDNFLGNGKNYLKEEIKSQDFQKLYALHESIINVYNNYGDTARQQGIDLGHYRHETTKHLIRNVRDFSRTPPFRHLKLNIRRTYTDYLHYWNLTLMERAEEDLNKIIAAGGEYTAIRPHIARSLQGIRGWIKLTQDRNLGCMRNWPDKATADESFKLHRSAQTHACLSLGDFTGGLTEIWQLMHSHHIHSFLEDRARLNMDQPNTPTLVKENLKAYLSICDEPDITKISLIKLENGIDGLCWIYSNTKPVTQQSSH